MKSPALCVHAITGDVLSDSVVVYVVAVIVVVVVIISPLADLRHEAILLITLARVRMIRYPP